MSVKQQNRASAKQWVNTTTQQRVFKTAQQENKRAMNSGRQDFTASVRTEVSPSVLTSVIQSVRQSDAFSRLQHPTGLFILTGFVPDVDFGNGRFASSDWPANKRERDVIFDPFLSPRNIICFGTRQAVFSVTRNRFRNRKQLARKGKENSSEVVVFYRAPRVPTRISILQNVFTHSTRHSHRQDPGIDLNGHKNGNDFAKSSLSNGVISSTF